MEGFANIADVGVTNGKIMGNFGDVGGELQCFFEDGDRLLMVLVLVGLVGLIVEFESLLIWHIYLANCAERQSWEWLECSTT